ncbi:hypothetical protein AMATHDRAFT_148154 [Amanita thiersii Skay4041]|uniref:Acyl-CoA thioesterase II domain-containing protein n=1 Tax=Amanita thiersii Skay4041 TaxID=703135 RepID=A0A2A9NF26_9AGAR|nr:hypothetical protein AMATHDRAFT_148154 [Amanita thiersii Skay4041]
MDDTSQVEHEQISTSLEVEQLDNNLFRSKSLWVPTRARGVFGGQVISQGLVSATNVVDPAFCLHSLHCYFLASGSPSTPIIYNVERLRQGRSYVVCTVRAIQRGNTIFVMLCSFQKPEPWQPSQQWVMPVVPPPEHCDLEETYFLRLMNSEEFKSNPRVREYCQSYAAERAKSPIAIRRAKIHEAGPDGVVRYMYWMAAKDIPVYEAPFQKCILSYLSDLHFIATASHMLGLKRYGQGPKRLSMTSTLDHSIYFYNNDFHCGDWLLYVMESPRIGLGRGVVHGRLYTQQGSLVAVTSQEGVLRADVRGPETKMDAKSKL